MIFDFVIWHLMVRKIDHEWNGLINRLQRNFLIVIPGPVLCTATVTGMSSTIYMSKEEFENCGEEISTTIF